MRNWLLLSIASVRSRIRHQTPTAPGAGSIVSAHAPGPRCFARTGAIRTPRPGTARAARPQVRTIFMDGRGASYQEPLDVAAATVLHGALTCPREDRARDALTDLAEHEAAKRLIAARLLEDDHGFLRPTPRAEATFRAAPEPRYLNWTA